MEAIRRQARMTFRRSDPSLFENDLSKLTSLMSTLTAKDVALDESIPSDGTRAAPVTYIEIDNSNEVTISMFALRQGSSLPLHDHPLMYGICKVIYGTVLIKNYSLAMDPLTALYQSRVTAVRNRDRILKPDDPALLLTPTRGNIHEIRCLSDAGAAFVDVLAPPYGTEITDYGARPCFYYSELPTPVGTNPGIVQLVKSKTHPSYWTDTEPYLGP